MLFDQLFGWILVLSVTGWSSGVPLPTFDVRMFFVYSLVLFGAQFCFPKFRHFDGGKPIAIFFGLIFFNLYNHGFQDKLIISSLSYLCLFMNFKIVYEHTSRPKTIRDFLLVGFLINLGVYVFQYFGFNPILDNMNHTEFGGILGNGPRFGLYVALLIPVLGHYHFALPAVASFLPLLTPNMQFTAIPIAMGCYLLRSKKWAVRACAVGVPVAGFVYLLGTASLVSRLKVWSTVLVHFFKAPLQGFGVGAFPFAVPEGVVVFDMTFYSSYLFLVACGGIGFLVPVVALWRHTWRYFDRSWECLSVIAFAFLCFYEYPVEIRRLWMTLVGLFAWWHLRLYYRRISDAC